MRHKTARFVFNNKRLGQNLVSPETLSQKLCKTVMVLARNTSGMSFCDFFRTAFWLPHEPV